MRIRRELLLLVAATMFAFCVDPVNAIPGDRCLPACYLGIQSSGRFFLVVAFIARLLQILMVQRPGSCDYGNITIPEAAFIPEPNGDCGVVQCERNSDGNLTMKFITCSNIALNRDFERENKLYPHCCPYPEIEESVPNSWT